jgi:hypothetical protein
VLARAGRGVQLQLVTAVSLRDVGCKCFALAGGATVMASETDAMERDTKDRDIKLRTGIEQLQLVTAVSLRLKDRDIKLRTGTSSCECPHCTCRQVHKQQCISKADQRQWTGAALICIHRFHSWCSSISSRCALTCLFEADPKGDFERMDR